MNSASHKHIDGGTYRIIAEAKTTRGYAITITEWTTYRNEVVYEVNRTDPEVRMFRLGTYQTEAEARKHGNVMWKADRSAMAAGYDTKSRRMILEAA